MTGLIFRASCRKAVTAGGARNWGVDEPLSAMLTSTGQQVYRAAKSESVRMRGMQISREGGSSRVDREPSLIVVFKMSQAEPSAGGQSGWLLERRGYGFIRDFNRPWRASGKNRQSINSTAEYSMLDAHQSSVVKQDEGDVKPRVVRTEDNGSRCVCGGGMGATGDAQDHRRQPQWSLTQGPQERRVSSEIKGIMESRVSAWIFNGSRKKNKIKEDMIERRLLRERGGGCRESGGGREGRRTMIGRPTNLRHLTGGRPTGVSRLSSLVQSCTTLFPLFFSSSYPLGLLFMFWAFGK